MRIKTDNGEVNVTPQGQGSLNTVLGAVGTAGALGVLGMGSGLLGLGGNRQPRDPEDRPVTRYEMGLIRENIAKEIADYDTIVVTNYFIRGKLCNKEAIEEIIASGKKVIVVTNTPYEEVSIPKNAKSVVVTFATSPDNIEVVAGTLYGKITPEGVWPVAYHA